MARQFDLFIFKHCMTQKKSFSIRIDKLKILMQILSKFNIVECIKETTKLYFTLEL